MKTKPSQPRLPAKSSPQQRPAHSTAGSRSRPRQPTRARNRTPRATGTAMVRIVHIHRRVNEAKRVTATQLAAELGVTVRTIMRDKAIMQDQLGVPIEWDAKAGTYYYTAPCEFLPLVHLDAADTTLLAMAGPSFAAMHGTTHGRALHALLCKIIPVVAGAVSVPADSVTSLFGPPTETERQEQENYLPLVEAIQCRREVELNYCNAQATAPTPRRVQPLRLTILEHCLVLIARDVAKQEIRTYRLNRIAASTPTGATFVAAPVAEVDAYLRDTVGRYSGKENHHVRVALAPLAARNVHETKWHREQQETPLPDGHTEFAFRVNSFVELRNKICYWHRHAKVVAPPALRQLVREDLAAALAQYEENGDVGSAGAAPPSIPPPSAPAPT